MASEQQPKILVVDDEEAILETMTFTFQEDYEVLTSTDARRGLEILDEQAPVAVVLSDQRMPEMSGVEFVTEVWRRHPATTRMILTGFSDDEVKAFRDQCERREVPAGHVFVQMGDKNESLHVILSGKVRVERIGVEGDVPIVSLGPGQTFGEMSFLDKGKRSADVEARVPTELFALGRPAFNELARTHPVLGTIVFARLALLVSRRMRTANRELSALEER